MKHELISKSLSQQGAAEYFGVTPQTVTNWKREGYLYGQQKGREYVLDSMHLLRFAGNGFRPEPDVARKVHEDFEAWRYEEAIEARRIERKHGVRNKATVKLEQSEALNILQMKREYLARRDAVHARSETLIRACDAGDLSLPAFTSWEVVTIYQTLHDSRDMLTSQISTLRAALDKVLETEKPVSVRPLCLSDVSPESVIEQTADAPVPEDLSVKRGSDPWIRCSREAAELITETAEQIKETFLDPGE